MGRRRKPSLPLLISQRKDRLLISSQVGESDYQHSYFLACTRMASLGSVVLASIRHHQEDVCVS